MKPLGNKYFALLVCLCCLHSVNMAQGLFRVDGAHIVMENAPNVVLNNASWQNNGQVAADSSHVLFIGTVDDSISGANLTQFGNITINKTSGNVLLKANAGISDTLWFVSGLFDLTSQTLTLKPDEGYILGETETRRLIGPLGGSVEMTPTLTAPSGANPGNMGLELSSSVNLDQTIIRRGHKPFPSVGGGQPGIDRHYTIIPKNNGAGTIRFHYLDAENTPSFVEADLVLFRSTDGGASWAFVGKDNQDLTADWVERGVPDVSGLWTLCTCPVINFTLSTSDETCLGAMDGRVDLASLSGGIGPYMHSIDSGMTYSSMSLFEGLGPGEYDYVVKDASGCESSAMSFTISTVPDVTPPTINCPTKTQRRNTDPGTCDYVVQGNELDPLPINDNCVVQSIVNDFNGGSSLGGSVFPKGKTTVTWTVTDGLGNSTTCTYDIRIRDREAPVFDNCPGNFATSVPFPQTGYSHSWPALTATDNCTKPHKIDIVEWPLSGSFFPLGTTTVNASATDKANNVGNCSFTVTVSQNCDPLPVGISNADIGNTGGFAGSVCYEASTKTYHINTSGSEIGNFNDGFHLVSLMDNNLVMDVIARVVVHPTNNNRDKVGVMIRQDNAPNAAFAATLIAGDNKTLLSNRAVAGMYATGTNGPTLPGPLAPGPVYWVRLQRLVNSFTASISPDGSTWTTIGTQTAVISGNYQVGIAATAGNSGPPVLYAVDNLSINGTAYRLESNGLTPLEVIAFPNPTQGELTVHVVGPSEEPISLSLTNALGQEILTKNLKLEGVLEHSLDMSRLAVGVYMLEVKSAKETRTVKVVKE